MLYDPCCTSPNNLKVVSTVIFYKIKDAKGSLYVKNKFSYPDSQALDASAFQPMQQDYYLYTPRTVKKDAA